MPAGCRSTAPSSGWTSRRRVGCRAAGGAATLPVGWEAKPAGRASIAFGTDWIRSGSSALLIVPSVIVPEECNVLVNPLHPDSAGISAVKVRR